MRSSPPRVRLERCKFDFPGAPASDLIWLEDGDQGLRIGVLPVAGGEMTSFQVRRGAVWREILYRALDYSEWPRDSNDGCAPLLWPAVGRSFTQEQIAEWRKTGISPERNCVQFGKSTYEIGLHGFARKFPWQLTSCSAAADSLQAACTLASSPATRKLYPFDFKLSATYRLDHGTVVMTYQVVAGANQDPMPFSIGNHIAFCLPFAGAGELGQCTIRTPGHLFFHQDPLCLLSGQTTRWDASEPIALTQKDLLDGVLGGYRHGESWLEVTDPASISLRISHAEIRENDRRLAADEDLFFVFWGDPALHYYCPEPWIGRPNSLNTGKGCLFLTPGAQFTWEIRITPKL